MEMTDGEICQEYRLAKNKEEQIRILADLNRSDQQSIINILISGGENVRFSPSSGGRRITKDLTGEKYKLLLYRRLDVLDNKIAKAEKEYRQIIEALRIFWSEE